MSSPSPELARSREQGEAGFTLIELMVVVLIIGVLLAIAVPLFLGAQERAKAKAASSNARAALSAAKALYTEKESYDDTSTSVAALLDAEPALAWQTGSSREPDQVSVDAPAATAPGTTLGIAVMSRAGDCFFVRDEAGPGGGTTFGRANRADPTTCTGTEALTAAASSSPETAGW